jgi:hypothetical protein
MRRTITGILTVTALLVMVASAAMAQDMGDTPVGEPGEGQYGGPMDNAECEQYAAQYPNAGINCVQDGSDGQYGAEGQDDGEILPSPESGSSGSVTEIDAEAFNLQHCVALFGSQSGTQVQYGSDGSAQFLTQEQVQFCRQQIQNVTSSGGGEVIAGGGPTAAGHDVVSGGSATGEGSDATENRSSAAGTTGPFLLPDTGGIALAVLGTGVLMIFCGLLVRRIAR